MLLDCIPIRMHHRKHSNPLEVSQTKRDPPRLPNELWMNVLEIASYPGIIIGDEACPPDEIERFIIMRGQDQGAAAAGHLFQKTKKRLGAVCRLWRQLVDAIIWKEWIIDLSSAPESIKRLEKMTGPTQKPVSRLNVRFSDGGDIKLVHCPPVSSLTIAIHPARVWGRTTLDTLASILHHPTVLRSLHLTLTALPDTNPDFLSPLASPDVPLLTLSLKISDVRIFHPTLTFPYITTFSIQTMHSGRDPGAARPTSWNLPSLINLSIQCPIGILDPQMETFISHLFVKQLRGLRMVWPHSAGIDTSLPGFWRGLPKLEVLSTEFAALFYDRGGKTLPPHALNDLLRRILPSNLRLRHLIQNGYSRPVEFVPGILEILKHCSKPDTISLSPATGNLAFNSDEEQRLAIGELQTICRSRGIRILDAEGVEIREMSKSR
ncbi:hypothetical protein M408DRAFT_204139 [Serendipita vermifera MAFF 305830]|uniref:Uncharacterized protein n=1 Tax=Serendipita vermifera MAFF 305830 TaxID=933852 RepID=A0A0C2WHA9_SERVB|nr:hypothetical protein M408DRAFT_204139 [Serendipita vermifera MAFF 305830]